MGRVVFRPRASADIDEIWEYTARHWGIDQANRYVQQIRDVVTKLGENPNLGRACDEIRNGHFKILAGSHIIIYRNVEEGIGIIRVLHQRMDISRHL